MKKLILTFTFLCALILNVSAQNNSIPQTLEQQKIAKKVATEWISMFYQAKGIDSIMKISKTPFALDNKKILNTNEELKDFFTSIIEFKKNQKTLEIKSEIYDYKYEIIDELIPINVLHIMVDVTEDDKDIIDHIIVSVEISGDYFKVISLRVR